MLVLVDKLKKKTFLNRTFYREKYQQNPFPRYKKDRDARWNIKRDYFGRC